VGRELSGTDEFLAVARDSPDSDVCRAIIDLDRYLYLVEQGYRVEYQGELLVAERENRARPSRPPLRLGDHCERPHGS
jgi:hypothetical protein